MTLILIIYCNISRICRLCILLVVMLLAQSVEPALAYGRAGNSAIYAPHIVPDNQADPTQLVKVTLISLTGLATFPLVSLPQKPTTPPKPKPAPAQKPVTPTARPVTRPAEPAKPTTSTKLDSSALALLTAGAESHKRVAALESTLDWRYVSKANLSARPTSAQGQKALEAALRSAQGTLILTKDGQARLEVTTPGKDALPRAKTLTDTKKLYAYRDDNDGELAALTERAFACA